MAFRLLSGLGGSGPITIGGGILGDLWRAEERGRASALYALGVSIAPVTLPAGHVTELNMISFSSLDCSAKSRGAMGIQLQTYNKFTLKEKFRSIMYDY